MIVNKNNIETDCFLDANNDIYRLITLFNSDESLKRFLIYTDKRPLEDYDVVNRKSLEEYGVKSIADLDLRDKQICRVPVLPANEEDGTLIVVSLISGVKLFEANSVVTTIAVDIFTPANQWIINEGIRPLQIAHVINNLIQNKLSQTGGVKYRLTNIINAQLSDVLVGYRLLFDSVIDD